MQTFDIFSYLSHWACHIVGVHICFIPKNITIQLVKNVFKSLNIICHYFSFTILNTNALAPRLHSKCPSLTRCVLQCVYPYFLNLKDIPHDFHKIMVNATNPFFISKKGSNWFWNKANIFLNQHVTCMLFWFILLSC
jgi:hypothetical protein